jgi:hypothetical protein
MTRMVLISVEDAVRLRDAARRERGAQRPEFYCPECKQPVLPTSKPRRGGPGSAHAEHVDRNAECALSSA